MCDEFDDDEESSFTKEEDDIHYRIQAAVEARLRRESGLHTCSHGCEGCDETDHLCQRHREEEQERLEDAAEWQREGGAP